MMTGRGIPVMGMVTTRTTPEAATTAMETTIRIGCSFY